MAATSPWTVAVRRLPTRVRWVTAAAVAVVGTATGVALGLWVWVSGWSGGLFTAEPLAVRAAVFAAAVGSVSAGPVAVRLLGLPVRTRWLLVAVVVLMVPVVGVWIVEAVYQATSGQ